MQRWADLGSVIGLDLTQLQWRTLADKGLEFWKIPPLRLTVQLRLANLARQAGFPVAALDDGATGWAKTYLEKLVGHVLGEAEPNPERAEHWASHHQSLLPETWRCEEMLAICGELALAIVELRREAEAGGGVNGEALISAWLDHNQPDWRDSLPLTIEDNAGRALVDGLLCADVLKGAGSVRARRVLAYRAAELYEEVELELAGTLDGKNLGSALATEWSRLRLFPSGLLARYITGELAVAEPDDEGCWHVRPSSGRTRFAVPLSTPIEIEFRGAFGSSGQQSRTPTPIRRAISNPSRRVSQRLARYGSRCSILDWDADGSAPLGWCCICLAALPRKGTKSALNAAAPPRMVTPISATMKR